MTTVDTRTSAALAVLAGRPVEEVAAGLGVEPEVVQHWADLLVEGGRLRLAGRMDPTSFEARDRFLTLIAHEFRTPLTIIGGWVETLRAETLPPEVAASALSTIARQVTYLERIARDALDAVAVAQGRLRLVVGDVDLRSVVVSVVDSMQDGAVVEPGPPLPVVGDATRLEQVAGDVLAHARRLAGDGQVLVTFVATPAAVTVDVCVPGGRLSFADAAGLFEPYSREDTSVGTGIGLFLSRALLSAHGGEIGVRSEDDATVFWFRVPVQGPSAGPLVERG